MKLFERLKEATPAWALRLQGLCVAVFAGAGAAILANWGGLVELPEVQVYRAVWTAAGAIGAYVALQSLRDPETAEAKRLFKLAKDSGLLDKLKGKDGKQ